MRRWLLILTAAGLTACSGAARNGVANIGDVFHQPQPEPVFVYDGHVKDVGFWLDCSNETRAFSTFCTIYVDLDADPAEWASLVPTDARRLVWFVSPFSYTRTPRSANGYVYREDFPQKWQAVKTLIGNHLDRTLAVYFVDEPDAVACGDQLDSDGKPCGTPGDGDWNPNLYNPDITRAAAIVHADLPTVKVGYNLGGGGLSRERVADGVDFIGVELYDDDWQAKLQTLETVTALPVWALVRGFVAGDPAQLDAPAAARLRAQWTWSQHDARVLAWYVFPWCCDDTTTGDKNFFTLSGGRLPLTRAVLEGLGH